MKMQLWTIMLEREKFNKLHLCKLQLLVCYIAESYIYTFTVYNKLWNWFSRVLLTCPRGLTGLVSLTLFIIANILNTNTSKQGINSIAQLLDNGNLVIQRSWFYISLEYYVSVSLKHTKRDFGFVNIFLVQIWIILLCLFTR